MTYGSEWLERVGGPSPQVLQIILLHFTDKETEAQRDGLTFQCHLGSGSQDLNLGLGHSKFKKYIPMPHYSSLTFPPHPQC